MLNDKVRLLRAITENASVALFIMNEVQHCVFMNPAAERLTGYTLEEVLGRPLHDVIHHKHPDGRDYPLEDCPIDRAFPEQNRTTGEEVFVHRDGHFYEVAFTASPIPDDAGDPIGTIIEVQDISERKRQQRAARAETELLELLNETATLIGGELDLDKLLQGITDAATKLTRAQFGAFFYNGEDENGEAYLLYTLSGAPREAFTDFGHPRPTALFGPTFRGEPAIRIADVVEDPRYGQWGPDHGMPKGHLPVRSYLAVSVKSRRGDVIGGLFFGHSEPDVFSERSERLACGIAAQAGAAVDNARLYAQAQRAMRQRDALLESERKARQEAEAASRLKDQFLATLSHELRTPLSAILGWLHILRKKGTSDPDVLGKGIDVIERSARMQHQLVEDLLDMSRITSGKLRLELAPVDAARPITTAVDLILPSAAAAGVRLTQDIGSVWVLGDAARLQQVVWNLLSNAVKFTPARGEVRITCRQAGDQAEIRVQDTGVGIRAEFIPHMFERFRQSDQSTTRQFGGLGLGLSLVDQLVRLHGGFVRAESAGEGHGACFTVTLPLAAELETPAEPVSDSDAVASHDIAGCILVVEDDEAGREFLARLLREAGAEVLTARDAAHARAILRTHSLQLLISDIGMPGEDGYQFVRWLRRQPPPICDLPAVALTAFARAEDKQTSREAGFDDHIAKPVDVPTLMLKVRALLQVGSGGRSAARRPH